LAIRWDLIATILPCLILSVQSNTSLFTHVLAGWLLGQRPLHESDQGMSRALASASHAVASALAARATVDHTVDAALAARATATHTVSAALLASITAAHTASAALYSRTALGHTVSAAPVARVGVAHSVSAALLVSLTTAHSVSAYLFAVPARLLVVPAERRIISPWPR